MGRMRFTTREWHEGELSEDEMARVEEASAAHVAAILPRLPKGVRVLGEAGGTESLHDARFVAVESTDRRLVIRARGYLWGRGYPMDGAAFVLTYEDAELVDMSFETFERVTSDEQCEILYCELDEIGDGRFEHRMLLWPPELGEIAIAFRDATVRVEPVVPTTD